MLRRGLTEIGVAAVALAVTVSIAGCGAMGPERASATAETAGPPAAVVARYEAALAQLRSGDEAGAVPALTSLSRAYPDYAGPLLNLAMVQARQGQDAEAVALFARAALVCARCAPVWNELGVQHRRQGRFNEAEQAYRKAIEAEPAYALPYYNLAVLYELYSQRPELALDYYQRYLDLGADAESGPEVEKWVADLQRRVTTTPKAARAEEAR